MTMTSLLGRDAGPRPWDQVPPLATCSYGRYDRTMGTAVRITRMALRGVTIPDPRYTDRDHWPVVRSLIPAKEIFHKGLPAAEFAALYRNDLTRAGIEQVSREIAALNLDAGPAPQRLVLLCYEDMPGAETGCHRRVFAAWWHAQTGQTVPELGSG